MDDEKAKAMIDKIFGQIFGIENPYSLREFEAKFAFDIRLPSEVTDYTTEESTWAQTTTGTKFIKFQNLIENSTEDESMITKREVNSLEDILKIWQETTVVATERILDSLNTYKSDTIYGSQKIYKSMDIHNSKNIALCDNINNSEFLAASQRSQSSTFALRVDDSKNVSNSFQVSWSGNISRSFFIKDCSDMSDCIFCSQVNGKRFCIANMQFTEKEYRKWEKVIKEWIVRGQ